ncbi:MAG TPA: phosphate starvation-inducible protein PhoH [Bacteroidales bacterium]|nr:MAG: phosphate starvation-inducible protein PhoH [Bacteroidetes bacterium GWF2_33_38]OFY85347.1 MAG: phosphate starvation-inducible protein PhoH [Bacteroidetes bacterium RIFOXYA2_FULL_33_7]HBF89285.1 phosphate starvation-inducible protein PhoH [Bacteroidales bacterium]
MLEKILYLDSINPIEFYGVNDSKLNIINRHFPKLKIIARGNEIKVLGDDAEILSFENKFDQLKEFLNKFNSFSENKLEKLLSNYSQELKSSENQNIITHNTSGRAIMPKTVTQQKMVEAYTKNDLIVAVGPAGSGKTYISIALAVRALKNKEVRKIIISRPAVEAEEHLGFLPGDLKEKLDPYLQPIYDALNDMLPSKKLADLIEDGVIQIAPLAFMRGRTLDNAFVILDEAQNATSNQMKMFLTRMGENAKFIVTGDLTQIDLPNKQNSGLYRAIKILRDVEGISIVEYNKDDISRHKLVKQIVEAYEKENQEKENKIL